MLIDTAGIEDQPSAEIQLWDEVRIQTERAIKTADAVIIAGRFGRGIDGFRL